MEKSNINNIKKYKFGTLWPDWAWNLVSNNKIILSNADDGQKIFYIYGKWGIEIAHYGDYLVLHNKVLRVENS